MLLANVATYALSHVPNLAVWMFQESAVGWDPVSLWKQMGILAKAVVIILFVMSGWSIGVMIDRAMAFSAARKHRVPLRPRSPVPCAKGKSKKPSRLLNATRRAIWRRLSPPACTNSRRTASPAISPANRLKPRSAPWSVPKPSPTPN